MRFDLRLVALVALIAVLAVGGGLWLASTGEAQGPAPEAPAPSAPAPATPAPSAAATPAPAEAPAQPADAAQALLAARLADRVVGRAEAPVTVIEYLSLTCPHCAAFARETYPRVKRELIETGRVRFIVREFPLNQVDLVAVMAARCLPPERHEAFVSTMLGSQDRWAFARGINHADEIARVAALAGMSRAEFDACVNDETLRRGLLEARLRAEQEHGVDSTPSFVINGRVVKGAVPYEQFLRAVEGR